MMLPEGLHLLLRWFSYGLVVFNVALIALLLAARFQATKAYRDLKIPVLQGIDETNRLVGQLSPPLRGLLSELADLRFSITWSTMIPTQKGPLTAIFLLDHERTTLAEAFDPPKGTRDKPSINFWTMFEDGSSISTWNFKEQPLLPQIERDDLLCQFVQMSVADAYRFHKQQVDTFHITAMRPATFTSQDDYLQKLNVYLERHSPRRFALAMKKFHLQIVESFVTLVIFTLLLLSLESRSISLLLSCSLAIFSVTLLQGIALYRKSLR
jgi:hypothetical protein